MSAAATEEEEEEEEEEKDSKTEPQTVVLMIGVPGSGKTTYARNTLQDHVHLSLDLNRTLAQCDRSRLLYRYEHEAPLDLAPRPPGVPPNPAGKEYKNALSPRQGSRNRKREYVQMSDALDAGSSIVIDDTNLTRELRWPYIAMARQYGAIVRAVSFTNTEAARMRNEKRIGADRVKDRILRMQCGMLERPHRSEGFDEILEIDK